MLYSHRYKFIFIKTLKTAGTSLEMYLSRHMKDPRDIITRMPPEDEKLRGGEGTAPRNHFLAGQSDKERPWFWNHMPASEIHDKLSPELWNACRKVTVERHPYEKAVSLAYYYMARNNESDFTTALDTVIARGNITNIDWYSLDGKIIADPILRYEHLLEDTNAFLKSVGMPETGELPQAKTRFRHDRRPAVELLSTKQKETLQQQCAREFAHFGYRP